MSTGWSCGTLEEGYKAVVGEEESERLKAEEESILKEIQDWLYNHKPLCDFKFNFVSCPMLVPLFCFPGADPDPSEFPHL